MKKYFKIMIFPTEKKPGLIHDQIRVVGGPKPPADTAATSSATAEAAATRAVAIHSFTLSLSGVDLEEAIRERTFVQKVSCGLSHFEYTGTKPRKC